MQTQRLMQTDLNARKIANVAVFSKPLRTFPTIALCVSNLWKANLIMWMLHVCRRPILYFEAAKQHLLRGITSVPNYQFLKDEPSALIPIVPTSGN